MSIELLLERIASALETLASAPAPAAPAPAAPAPAAPAAPAPAAPAPAAPAPAAPAPAAPAAPAPAPAAPAPAAPAPAQASMTVDELNAALVAEYQRLGSRDPIVKAMQDLGVTRITDLAPDKYAELLAAVKGLSV